MDGTGLAVDAFEKLGVTQKEIIPIQNDHVKVMGLLADKFYALEDGAVKTGLAYEVFGGRNTELLTLLAQGSGAFEEYRKEAELFGLALSTASVAGVEKANDSITRLKALGQGLSHQITAALSPAIEMVVTKFRDWLLALSETKGGIEGFAKTIADKVLSSLEAIGSGIVEFVNIGKRALAAFSQGRIRGIKKELEDLQAVEFGFNDSLGRPEAISKTADEIQRTAQKVKELQDELKELSPDLIDSSGWTSTFEKLRAAVEKGPSGEGARIKAGALFAPKDIDGDKLKVKVAAESLKEFNSNLSKSRALYEAIRTPAQEYAETIEELNRLKDLGGVLYGGITSETYLKSVEQAQKRLDEQKDALKEIDETAQAMGEIGRAHV